MILCLSEHFIVCFFGICVIQKGILDILWPRLVGAILIPPPSHKHSLCVWATHKPTELWRFNLAPKVAQICSSSRGFYPCCLVSRLGVIMYHPQTSNLWWWYCLGILGLGHYTPGVEAFGRGHLQLGGQSRVLMGNPIVLNVESKMFVIVLRWQWSMLMS